jgi:hypothetical protein
VWKRRRKLILKWLKKVKMKPKIQNKSICLRRGRGTEQGQDRRTRRRTTGLLKRNE